MGYKLILEWIIVYTLFALIDNIAIILEGLATKKLKEIIVVYSDRQVAIYNKCKSNYGVFLGEDMIFMMDFQLVDSNGLSALY